jgi:hypothetical protein
MRIKELVDLCMYPCVVSLCVLLNFSAKGQENRISLPQSPASPQQMQECDQLQTEWDKIHQQLETEHQNCLDAHSREQPNPNSGSGPNSICTHSECQDLHDAVFNVVEPESQASVQQCRWDVSQYQAAVQQSQQQLQQQLQGYRDQAQQLLASGCAQSAPGDGQGADADGNCMGQPDPKSSKDPKDSQIAKDAAQLIKDASADWEPTKALAEVFDKLSGALDKLLDAQAGVDTALNGEAPCTALPDIEKLRNFVNKQETVLSLLKGKQQVDWLNAAGANNSTVVGCWLSLAPACSAMPSAQAYLNGWSGRLTTIQQLIQKGTPVLSAGQTVLRNPVVVGLAVDSETAMSDFGLCADAVGNVIDGLNNASTDIDSIQSKLNGALGVVDRYVAPNN